MKFTGRTLALFMALNILLLINSLNINKKINKKLHNKIGIFPSKDLNDDEDENNEIEVNQVLITLYKTPGFP